MKDELKKSEERFRAAFDNTAVPMSLASTDGKRPSVHMEKRFLSRSR